MLYYFKFHTRVNIYNTPYAGRTMLDHGRPEQVEDLAKRALSLEALLTLAAEQREQ